MKSFHPLLPLADNSLTVAGYKIYYIPVISYSRIALVAREFRRLLQAPRLLPIIDSDVSFRSRLAG